MGDVDARPAAARGRTTRRNQVEEAAASTHRDQDISDEGGGTSCWQKEVDSICTGEYTPAQAPTALRRVRNASVAPLATGTHPLLVAELKKHEQVMQLQISQAKRCVVMIWVVEWE